MISVPYLGSIIAGICAGTVTGLLGAGGGMILVPLLQHISSIKENELFPSSVAIILPTVVITLLLSKETIPLQIALPYLFGSCIGGIAAGIWGSKIPTGWLHRFLGAMILWGGIRYLC